MCGKYIIRKIRKDVQKYRYKANDICHKRSKTWNDQNQMFAAEAETVQNVNIVTDAKLTT